MDVHFDPVLQRYVMIVSNDTTLGYAESVDGLSRTIPISLGNYGPIATYPTAVGFGANPHSLGKRFYVYYTHLRTNGSGWKDGSLRRFTLSCD